MNESSLMEEEDEQMILTARSESAIDDLDDVSTLSKSRAINSSFINLKRNNMLLQFAQK